MELEKALYMRRSVRKFTEEQIKAEASRCLGCGASIVDPNKCIGCGRCDHACPEKLSVSRIRLLTDCGKTDGIKKYDVNLCTGCGACSYVCPARIDVAATVLKAKRIAAQGKKEGAK